MSSIVRLRSPFGFIILAIFVLVLHYVFGFFGHFGFDDVKGYAFYAHKWIHIHPLYVDDDFFSFRWGIIAPLSLFYGLFGIRDISSAIPSSLFFLGPFYLLLRLNKDRSMVFLFFAFCLYCFDNWTLYYSDKIMPDLAVSFCVFTSIFSLYQLRFGQWKALRSSMIFTVAVCYGFLCKMSVFLVFPVYLILFFEDVIKRRHQRFWFYSIAFGIVFFACYLVTIYILTGSPFSRWITTMAGQDRILGSSFSQCAYYEQGWQAMAHRLSIGFYQMLYNSGMLSCVILTLPVIVQSKWFNPIMRKGKIFFWVKIWILMMLCANFMTTSAKHYNPMCLDVRQFLFLVPFSVLLSAHYLSQMIHGLAYTKKWWWIPLLLIISVYCLPSGNMKWYYLSLMAYLLLTHFTISKTKNKRLKWILLACFIPISSMLCISNMRSARQHGYKNQKEVVQFIKDRSSKTIVFTDEVSANIGTYLMAFDTTTIRFVHQMDSLDRFKLAFDEQWLLKNPSTQSMLVFKDANQVLNRHADSLQNRGVEPIQFGSIMLYHIAD